MIVTKSAVQSVLALLAAAFLTLVAPSMVAAQDVTENTLASAQIANFDKVSSTIWRGAAPSDQALETMARSGIRTIVDLRMDGGGTLHEKEQADHLGLHYVHIPMGFNHPSLAQIDSFLNVALDSQSGPIFIHCAQGADRTGTMCAIYRRLVDNWSFDEAYAEMRLHHFKPFLSGLKRSVEDFPYASFKEKLSARAASEEKLAVRLANNG